MHHDHPHHRRDKSFKQQTPKHRNTPSFSSSLLDEICRSIDDHAGFPQPHPHPVRTSRDTAHPPPPPANSTKPRPAFHVQKWMDKDKGYINPKPVRKSSVLPECGIHECDSSALFSCNSNSHSSFSDSSGALSISDTELVRRAKPCKKNDTCFTTRPKPKPVRTTRDKPRFEDDPPIKSPSTALKLYAGLKKMKQPISPGAKLTSFINSLFANNKSKKNRVLEENFRSAPPSLSSTRSDGDYRDHQKQQRTVGFHPVGAIVDRDSKRGKKSIYVNEDFGYKRPPLPPKIRASAGYNRKNEILRLWKDEEEDEEEDDEDAVSESSSDLFEIDHLGLFGSRRFSQELPVYETTCFDRQNCGLVR